MSRYRVNFAYGTISGSFNNSQTTVTGTGFSNISLSAGQYLPIVINPGYLGSTTTSEIAYVTNIGSTVGGVNVVTLTRSGEGTAAISGSGTAWVAGPIASDFDVTNLTSTGTLTLSNNLTVSGATTLNGLTNLGNSTISGNLVVASGLTVSGVLSTASEIDTGNLNVGGNLTITGTSTHIGNATFNGSATFTKKQPTIASLIGSSGSWFVNGPTDTYIPSGGYFNNNYTASITGYTTYLVMFTATVFNNDTITRGFFARILNNNSFTTIATSNTSATVNNASSVSVLATITGLTASTTYSIIGQLYIGGSAYGTTNYGQLVIVGIG